MSIQHRSGQPAAVLGGIRIPFCKSGSHYAHLRIVDLMTASMKALVEKFNLKGQKLDEVSLGAVFDHPAVWNLARQAVIDSGLSLETPAFGIQRACATSLEATINISNKIALGQIDVGVAGGVESMSDAALFCRPALVQRILKHAQAKTILDKWNLWKGIRWKDLKPGIPPFYELSTGKNMGQYCEMMVKEWNVSRQEQDEIALRSHQNTIKAYERGFYKDLVAPFQGLSMDKTVYKDSSKEKLAKLRPVFDTSGKGTLTAGNSSPFTDGAACVLLASEAWAKAHGFEVQAYFTEHETTAINFFHEGLLLAPAYAGARLMQRTGHHLQDFDFYEIHEAFAGQVACTLKAWESETFCREKVKVEATLLGSIAKEKINVCGGSVALGHPFGATGARLVTTLAKLLQEKGSGKGLISICTGGGMGTVAILER